MGKSTTFIYKGEYNTFSFDGGKCWFSDKFGLKPVFQQAYKGFQQKTAVKNIQFNLKNLTFAVQKFGIMLAVVKIAGQQFKVKAGDSLYVPHIEGNDGDKVEFSEVLMTDNAGTVAIGDKVSAIVKAEILKSLVQGDKVIAFKMKRRKGFRKKHGHRTHYTKIQVTEIA